eukprot:UN28939
MALTDNDRKDRESFRHKFLSMSDDDLLSDYKSWSTRESGDSALDNSGVEMAKKSNKKQRVKTRDSKKKRLSTKGKLGGEEEPTEEQEEETPLRGSMGNLSVAGMYKRTKTEFFEKDLPPELAKHFDDWRRRISPSRVLIICVPFSILLLIPASVVTATSESLQSHTGDGCLHHWKGAATVLLMYMCLYILMFLKMATLIKDKIDGFFIKFELKWTAIASVFTLIPWFVFNNVIYFENFNE